MSQVVVTSDTYKDRREQSLAEEKKIDRASRFDHWQNKPGVGVALLEKAIGVAVLPIMAFWGFLLALLSVGMGIALFIFRALSFVAPSIKKKLAR